MAIAQKWKTSADESGDRQRPGRLGHGRPLAADVQSKMAPLLDDPLDDVRVHTDVEGANFAREQGARAVTYGRDIAFAAGEYRPSTLEGDAVIAHELAHVVQQRGAGGDLDPSGQRIAPEGSDMESDATMSAVRATSAIHGGPASAGVAKPQRRSPGLALHGCSSTPSLKTNSGQFKTSTYAVNDTDSGKDTAKNVGAEIRASFTPNDTVVSKRIAIVQMMKADHAGTPELFPNEVGRATTAAQGDAGWAVDRVAGKKSGYYGIDDSGAAGVNASLGSRDASGTTVDATWYDKISLPRQPGETYDTTVASYAVDTEHNSYLGALGWGFECDSKGNVTRKPLSVVAMGAPSGIHKSAVEGWNTQAKDPDAAKRNAPVQDQLPAP